MKAHVLRQQFFYYQFFSSQFQIEILIVVLGSWPVRSPSFKVTFFLLSFFSGDSRLGF